MRVCTQAQLAVYVLYRTKDKNIITVGTEGNVKSYDAQKRHTRPYVCVSVNTHRRPMVHMYVGVHKQKARGELR